TAAGTAPTCGTSRSTTTTSTTPGRSTSTRPAPIVGPGGYSYDELTLAGRPLLGCRGLRRLGGGLDGPGRRRLLHCRLASGGLAGGLRRCAVGRRSSVVGDGGRGRGLAERLNGVQAGRLPAVGLAVGERAALAREDPLEPPLAVGADFELRSHYTHPLVMGPA